MYPYLGHFHGQEARALLAFYGRGAGRHASSLFSHEARFHNGLFALRLLRGSHDAGPAADVFAAKLEAAYPGFAQLPSLVRAQVLEYETLLGGYLLSSQGDRMSSAHSSAAYSPRTS